MVVACCCPIFHISYCLILPSCYLLHLLGQCGLWYSIHCRTTRCRIPLFVLWSYLDHGFIYPACLGVWSVNLGLASAFFGLFTGSLMLRSFLVWFLGCISWCSLLLSFWWSCIFLHTLFDVCRRSYPPFLVDSSSGLLLVTISLISKAYWLPYLLLTRFVGSCLWWFRSMCRCCLVPVVSRNGFSIRVAIRSLVLFVWYLLLVAINVCLLVVINVCLSTSTSSLILLVTIMWSRPMLTPVRLWRRLACLSRCSQFRSSLHRLGFSTSISSLPSSGTWYSWLCTFLMLTILPRCRRCRFSIRAQICPLSFP